MDEAFEKMLAVACKGDKSRMQNGIAKLKSGFTESGELSDKVISEALDATAPDEASWIEGHQVWLGHVNKGLSNLTGQSLIAKTEGKRSSLIKHVKAALRSKRTS